ncbi:MAG: DsbA family protein [Hyphomicrobium sp.]
MLKFNLPAAGLKAGAIVCALVAGALMLNPALAVAQDGDGSEVSVEELMKPGALSDIAVGAADAKVTIVEYFSMTCPHCAEFANSVYPELKKKYVDTGKVRFVFREFPHNNRAYAASMLARCVPEDKSVAMIEGLMETQATWAFEKENAAFRAALLEVAKQSGFTQETFEKCLTDQPLLDKLTADRNRAAQGFAISRIPTIFINGKRVIGEPSLSAVEKVIEPLLPKS